MENRSQRFTIEMRFISALCCALSASGNCYRKNVAVWRENHKLSRFFASFIKILQSIHVYADGFSLLECSMIPTSSYQTTIISEMAVSLSSLVVCARRRWRRVQLTKVFLFSTQPDNAMPKWFSQKCCMCPIAAGEVFAVQVLSNNLSTYFWENLDLLSENLKNSTL